MRRCGSLTRSGVRSSFVSAARPVRLRSFGIRGYADGEVAGSVRQRRSGFWRIALPVGMAAATLGVASMLVQIDAGQVGLVDRFGIVSPSVLTPGLNLVLPFGKIIRFSTRTQTCIEAVDVPTKEGGAVHLEVAVLYHLDPASVRRVYIDLGPRFEQVVLQPQIRSIMREVTSEHEAKALYSASGRLEMSHRVKDLLNERLASRGIVVEDVPFKQVVLPERLVRAIEQKMAAEQEAESMQWVLRRAELEAQQKAVVARGIADFQKIVSEGINENLLRWKGIEATERLANSPNAKIIIIGGRDGLPIVFGEPTPTTAQSPPPTVPPKEITPDVALAMDKLSGTTAVTGPLKMGGI